MTSIAKRMNAVWMEELGRMTIASPAGSEALQPRQRVVRQVGVRRNGLAAARVLHVESLHLRSAAGAAPVCRAGPHKQESGANVNGYPLFIYSQDPPLF